VETEKHAETMIPAGKLNQYKERVTPLFYSQTNPAVVKHQLHNVKCRQRALELNTNSGAIITRACQRSRRLEIRTEFFYCGDTT
jgi:hypothetical protein